MFSSCCNCEWFWHTCFDENMCAVVYWFVFSPHFDYHVQEAGDSVTNVMHQDWGWTVVMFLAVHGHVVWCEWLGIMDRLRMYSCKWWYPKSHSERDWSRIVWLLKNTCAIVRPAPKFLLPGLVREETLWLEYVDASAQSVPTDMKNGSSQPICLGIERALVSARLYWNLWAVMWCAIMTKVPKLQQTCKAWLIITCVITCAHAVLNTCVSMYRSGF